MDSGLTSTIVPSSEDYRATPEVIYWYGSAVGSLVYAMTMTRPDIAFALSIVSRYCNNSNSNHVAAVTRILLYIKGPPDEAIVFCGECNVLDLTGYTDADYGSANGDRTPTSGWLFCLGGGPISWSSKRQSAVALRSYEAKYIALNEAGKEAVWLQRILKELDLVSKANNSAAVGKLTDLEEDVDSDTESFLTALDDNVAKESAYDRIIPSGRRF